MAKDQIVIVTQTDDPHTDEVIVALERMGHEPVRLNTDEIPVDSKLSMSWTNDPDSFDATIEVLTSGRTMNSGSVRSVWWRRPAHFGLPSDLSVQENEFATDEIDHALRSLWGSLDCYWISEPERIRQASWKGEQLTRARRLGFEIPRTLITTDPEQARDFFYACDKQMIFKVMTDPFLGAAGAARRHPDEYFEPYEAPTTIVTEPDLDLLDSVRVAPCLFQEYVPKKVELRVTVIGNEIFAAEIHSQDNEKTAIDWRHYDVDIPYGVASLPPEVADRCLALVKGYGLNFSSMDLILTPDDRYVFLENNANGQFIFIEDKVPELAMTDALASCLVRGANE
ncbi:MAG TPA: hypothetical protein VGX49_11105 [Jatrophihabitans sp.]|nr:hypothetical protein [Jatrophihabitans sp.]